MTLSAFTVGLISDTHGLLRPEALTGLAGCDYIIHAGDIGDASIIDALAALAPVTAMRGNIDSAGWAERFARTAALEIGGVGCFVLHRLADLDFAPKERGYQVVVSGHSHKASLVRRDHVLLANPGSAGPRRFSLPLSVARLDIAGDRVIHEEIVMLPVRHAFRCPAGACLVALKRPSRHRIIEARRTKPWSLSDHPILCPTTARRRASRPIPGATSPGRQAAAIFPTFAIRPTSAKATHPDAASPLAAAARRLAMR